MYLYVVLYAWGDRYIDCINFNPNGRNKETTMDAPNDMKQPSTPILGDIGPINGGDGVPDP